MRLSSLTLMLQKILRFWAAFMIVFPSVKQRTFSWSGGSEDMDKREFISSGFTCHVQVVVRLLLPHLF
jgi:hypothetical protein